MTPVEMPSCFMVMFARDLLLKGSRQEWHGVSERGITIRAGELGITPGKKEKVTSAMRS
jgi:hypothetical protein